MSKPLVSAILAGALALACSAPARPTPVPGVPVTIGELDDSYLSTSIRLTGKVIKVTGAIDFPDLMRLDSDGVTVIVRFEATRGYDPGDTVAVTGKYEGQVEYPTVSGGTTTAPTIDATQGSVEEQQ